MSGNREYKSDLFSMLLEDPNNALQLYNALDMSSICVKIFWKKKDLRKKQLLLHSLV